MTHIGPRRLALIVLVAVLATAGACSKDKKGEATTTSAPTTATSESTTTTVPLTKESIVLAPDGLGSALPFGLNAARAINLLIQALGPAEKNTPLPVGQACGATRRLQWGSFQVLVNEVGATSGAGRPGFAGWFIGAPGAAQPFKTDKGITVGSTAAQLQAAYPEVIVARGEQGPGFSVTLATGIIIGQLDVLGPNGKIKNMQSGSYCGPG
jgi:hypothetical protein